MLSCCSLIKLCGLGIIIVCCLFRGCCNPWANGGCLCPCWQLSDPRTRCRCLWTHQSQTRGRMYLTTTQGRCVLLHWSVNHCRMRALGVVMRNVLRIERGRWASISRCTFALTAGERTNLAFMITPTKLNWMLNWISPTRETIGRRLGVGMGWGREVFSWLFPDSDSIVT